MSVEDYFYSELSAEDIESNIFGAVVWNKKLDLSTEAKALARENIGAGKGDTSFIVLGYFDTLAEMQAAIVGIPDPGDAYGVLAPVPEEQKTYSVYIWSAEDAEWQNHGAISENPGVTILGYYDSLGEMTIALADLPQDGDAYAIMNALPESQRVYNIYVWDSYHLEWINNGPLGSAAMIIDNSSNDDGHTFSSRHIRGLFSNLTIGTAQLEDDSVTADKIPDGVISMVYSATIGTSWSGTEETTGEPGEEVIIVSAPYTQTIEVLGLLDDDTPVIDLVPDADYSIATEQLSAWGEIYKFVASEDELTVYAHVPLAVSMPIKLLCVRK